MVGSREEAGSAVVSEMAVAENNLQYSSTSCGASSALVEGRYYDANTKVSQRDIAVNIMRSKRESKKYNIMPTASHKGYLL